MNCHECHDLLRRRLDGEAVAGAAELREHLAACATCRHRWGAATQLLDGLREWVAPVLAPDFARHMAALVVQDRRKRQASMRRRLWATAALAASVLLMALAGYFWLPNPRPAPMPEPFVQKKQPEPEAPEVVPSLRQSAQEAGSAVASLTERLADQTLEHVRVLLSASAPPLEVPSLPSFLALEEMEDPLEPAAESLRQTGQGVSEGLEPVTRSARRAVDFLMRELSSLDSR